MQAAAEQKFKLSEDRSKRAYKFADLSRYTWQQRFAIRAADILFYSLIKFIGSTIRWQIEGWKNWEHATKEGKLPIYTLWHNRVFLSTYFWQRRSIVVMTSRSFDGEYIARFVQRFGYGTARGSSTHGAVGALVEMVRLMRSGSPTAFTIDGPKGPRYVAKNGAVLLAKKTGNPILPFTITPQKFWTIRKSWDQLQIPKPFTRARIEIAAPIYVSADADDQQIESKRQELQRALDHINNHSGKP